MALTSYSDIDDQFVIVTDDPDAGQTHAHALSPGEINLWAAVLAVAISDLCGKPRGLEGDRSTTADKDTNYSRLRWHALMWIQSDQEDVGSFEFVCNVLGLEIDAVRERLLKLTPERAKKVYNRIPNFNTGQNTELSTTMRQPKRRRRVQRWGRRTSNVEPRTILVNNGAKANAHGMNGNGHQANMVDHVPRLPSAGKTALCPEQTVKAAETQANPEPNEKPVPENNGLATAILNGGNGHRVGKLVRDELATLPNHSQTLPAAKKQGSVPMSNHGNHTNSNHGNESEIGRLKELLGKFQAQLAQAEAEAVKRKAVVDNLKAAVEVLAGAQIGNGALTEGNTRAQVKTSVKKSRRPNKPPAAKHPGALKRRHEALSITDAIRQILAASAEPIHHDQITRSVFQVSKNDFERARASVASRLSQGVKKGLWRALGAGRYAKLDREASGQGPGAIAVPTGN